MSFSFNLLSVLRRICSLFPKQDPQRMQTGNFCLNFQYLFVSLTLSSSWIECKISYFYYRRVCDTYSSNKYLEIFRKSHFKMLPETRVAFSSKLSSCSCCCKILIGAGMRWQLLIEILCIRDTNFCSEGLWQTGEYCNLHLKHLNLVYNLLPFLIYDTV
jgi:hypothetical protein